MNTVHKRLLTATAIAATAFGGLAMSVPAATAASSCSWYCINAANVSGTTDGAVFSFSTSTLTRTKVVVTDLAGGNAYTVKQDDSWGTNYQITAADSSHFKQGTVYKYEIYATDTAGATWRTSGQFVTLARTASVKYTNLHIVDDGDNLGPGDFLGFGRCGENASWLELAPLQGSQVAADEVELSDGANLGLSGYYPCTGLIGATIEAQTATADDDKWVLGSNWEYWGATSPHANEGWSSSGSYEAAYAYSEVSDPLDPASTGSATAPIYAASPATDPLGQVAGIRYQVSGTATFTHTAPSVSLPNPTSGPALLGLNVKQGYGADTAVVTWHPNAYPAITGALKTRVEWKPRESDTWEHSILFDPNDSSFQLTNLKLGTLYDIAVSQLMPGDLLELRSTTSYTVPGTPPPPTDPTPTVPSPTTPGGSTTPGGTTSPGGTTTPGPVSRPTMITGWSSKHVTATVGTSLRSKVKVSTDGAPRTLALQSKKTRAASWTTVTTVRSDPAGNATLKVKVAARPTRWRIFVPAANGLDEATSTSRMLTPRTKISGFNRSTVTTATGDVLRDTVAVTPGGKRTVKLFYRKIGTTAWTLQATLVTKANGVVTLPEVARKGAYQWVLKVRADPHQGGSARTALRRITGN